MLENKFSIAKLALVLIVLFSLGTALGITAYLVSVKNLSPVGVQPTASPKVTPALTATPTSASLNHFISRNKKLSFLYRKDWICKEVVYDTRVDCYPVVRSSEEYDAGLDQPIVYFPDITISIENCVAEKVVPKNSDTTLYYYIKNYNGCKVQVLAEDNKTDTEEKLDSIIINSN